MESSLSMEETSDLLYHLCAISKNNYHTDIETIEDKQREMYLKICKENLILADSIKIKTFDKDEHAKLSKELKSYHQILSSILSLPNTLRSSTFVELQKMISEQQKITLRLQNICENNQTIIEQSRQHLDSITMLNKRVL